MDKPGAESRRSGSQRYEAAAICTPGLEFVCRRELTALGCKPKPAGPGTLEFSATARQLYAANVWLRTASRVVVRLARFRSTDFAHLQDRLGKLDWSPWLADGIAPRFRVSANDSKLYHTQAIAQRFHQVVGAPSIGEPEQLFIVRLERNTVTISVDASGEALHRRPWRTELGSAPLRTTMAAAMLIASDWDGTTPLLDPFCGSGTIPIEGALLARQAPPGGDRSFAFQQWPSYEPGTWASVAGEIASRRTTECCPIYASDRDGEVIQAAKANAVRAGVGDDIEFSTMVVSHLPARPGPGLVATNPPYGRRMGAAKLDGLYRRLGAVVRERCEGWSLALVCPDPKLAAKADGRLTRVARFRHGGLPVELLGRSGDEDQLDLASRPEPASRPQRSAARTPQSSPSTH